MQVNELAQKISHLPKLMQQEVIDFVAFLEARQGVALAKKGQAVEGDWSLDDFQEMSLSQAMRGLESEPDIYTVADLKERW